MPPTGQLRFVEDELLELALVGVGEAVQVQLLGLKRVHSVALRREIELWSCSALVFFGGGDRC